MKKNWKLFFGAMAAFVSMTFASCSDDNADQKSSDLEVTPATVKLTESKGSTVELTLTSTTNWSAETTGSGFTIDKSNGAGNGTIIVTATEENTFVTDVALGTIVITNATGSKTIDVSQTGSTENVYFYTNVGMKAVSDNPTVATYNDWQAKGSGIANVTFSGTEKTTVTSTGLANTGAYVGASGQNSVFFGTLPSYLSVNNITVPSSQTNMKLTFGASCSEKVGTDYVNTFDKEKFLVSLSADGTNWKPVSYSINEGDKTHPFWVSATANFTLKTGVSAIYVKFEAGTASAFHLDDIILSPSTTGGQTIDLSDFPKPSVATTDCTDLKDVSVTLGGSLSEADVASYAAVGVQYILFSTGTVNDIDWSKATKTAATTKGTPWTVNVAGLTTETTYAYRAYATPTTGTELYGEAKTFKTTKRLVLNFESGIVATPEFPTTKHPTPPALATHTIGGYEWKFMATESYYVMSSGDKLLIGKQDSYIEIPAVSGKKLTSVEFITPAGSSSRVTVCVKDAAGAVVTGGEDQTLAPGKPFTYTLTGTATATSYRLTVTNANNFQIGTLTVTYE